MYTCIFVTIIIFHTNAHVKPNYYSNKNIDLYKKIFYKTLFWFTGYIMPLFLPFACNHSFSTHSCVLLLVTLTFSAKLYVCVEFLPSWWQPLHPSLATLYAPHIFRTLPTKLKHTSKYGGSWKGSRRRGQTYCQTWSVLVICKCCSWVVLLLLVSYFCFTFFFHKMWRLHRYRLFEHNHWGLLWNAAAASACGHIAPEHIHTYIHTHEHICKNA